MLRRLIGWFRPPAPQPKYNVYARSNLVAQTYTKAEALEWLDGVFNELEAQDHRGRSGFGGTYNLKRDARRKAFLNQCRIERIKDAHQRI